MNKSPKNSWSENYLSAQGYSDEEINRYYNVSEQVIINIKNDVFAKLSQNKSVERKAELAFGQAGCGKTTYFNKLDKYIILDIDSFREYYPYQNEIIELINYNHQKNNLPEENPPGRDFTNFTRKFVGILLDELIDECIKFGYNIALQKNITSSQSVFPLLEKLNANSYEINLVLPLANSKVSWQRCQKRNEINNLKLNYAPKSFHDNYVAQLPDITIQLIKDYILNSNYINRFKLLNNNDVIIVDKNSNIDDIKNYILNILN